MDSVSSALEALLRALHEIECTMEGPPFNLTARYAGDDSDYEAFPPPRDEPFTSDGLRDPALGNTGPVAFAEIDRLMVSAVPRWEAPCDDYRRKFEALSARVIGVEDVVVARDGICVDRRRVEYVSASLSEAQVRDYLRVLPSLLGELGLVECSVMYGWDCDLDLDDLWQSHGLTLDELSGFIESAIERGIFRPGRSDLIVESFDGALSVRACHESDLHVRCRSERVLTILLAAARFPEFSFKKVAKPA